MKDLYENFAKFSGGDSVGLLLWDDLAPIYRRIYLALERFERRFKFGHTCWLEEDRLLAQLMLREVAGSTLHWLFIATCKAIFRTLGYTKTLASCWRQAGSSILVQPSWLIVAHDMQQTLSVD